MYVLIVFAYKLKEKMIDIVWEIFSIGYSDLKNLISSMKA